MQRCTVHKHRNLLAHAPERWPWGSMTICEQRRAALHRAVYGDKAKFRDRYETEPIPGPAILEGD